MTGSLFVIAILLYLIWNVLREIRNHLESIYTLLLNAKKKYLQGMDID